MQQALLAAIRATPDDDSPRSVFADLLITAGDPRGEFIALQLGPASPASERRATTLLRKHLDAWLGELKPHVVKASVTFARGFPDTARVSIRTDEALERARSLEGWFSFTALEFKERSFFTESMRALRKATGVDTQGLRELHTVAPPLERLSARVDARGFERVLPIALQRLPKLQFLRLSTGRLDHDRVTTLFRLLPPALTTLTLDDVAVVPEQGHRLLASAPQGLERVVLGSATFTRTSQGWSGQGLAFS